MVKELNAVDKRLCMFIGRGGSENGTGGGIMTVNAPEQTGALATSHLVDPNNCSNSPPTQPTTQPNFGQFQGGIFHEAAWGRLSLWPERAK